MQQILRAIQLAFAGLFSYGARSRPSFFNEAAEIESLPDPFIASLLIWFRGDKTPELQSTLLRF